MPSYWPVSGPSSAALLDRAANELDDSEEPDYSPVVGYGYHECPANPNRDLLYAQFQPLIGSLLRRFGRTPELRKDLVGEIYCQFCRIVNSYNPERGVPICAYIPRMLSHAVFNYVRDYWRKENRYVPMEDEERALPADNDPWTSDWEDLLFTDEFRDALPKAIARLPHRQRLVLVWRYYDEREFDQIAEQLAIKPATARSLLRHAINSLRVQLSRGETD